MVLRPDQFTEKAQEAIVASQELVRTYKHSQWDVEHILLALLQQEGGVPVEILGSLDVPIEAVSEELQRVLEQTPKTAYESSQVYVTPRAAHLLENAKAEADRLKDEFISTEHLLIAATMERQGDSARILKQYGIDQEKVYKALADIRGGHRVTDPRAESKYRSLEKYSIDLTALAQQGKLDPVVGRDLEVKRVMQTLTRRTKNNPVLTGEAGRGQDGHCGRSGPEHRGRRRPGVP